MRIVHNIALSGPTTTKFAAYGYAGNTIMALGAGTGLIATVTDKVGLTGKFVVGLTDADAETIRLPLRNNAQVQGESFVTITPTTCTADQFDALSCELDGVIARMSGGVKYASGTPSTIMTIAAGFRPAAVTSISCIHVGAATSTNGWAMVGADGVVTVDSAVTAGSRVHVDGSWTVAQ